MKKVFVIIVTYKGQQWYDRCLQSLRESTYPVTTIVVDNASNDGSVEYIREHFPEVVVIPSDINLGFGNANNVGLKYAREHDADYVFLLNQDTWVNPDMMEKLMRVAELHPQYGLYSPMHMAVDGQRINMHLEFPNPSIFISDCYCQCIKDIYTILYSNAAGWLLPRRTLEMVGGFTPLIYHYGEDDDYMRRLDYYHLPMALVPAARMVHDSGKRLDNAKALSVYSNTYFPEDYVDPRTTYSMCGFQLHFLWKVVLRLFRGDLKGANGYWCRVRYIHAHAKEIDYYRTQNRLQQPNWIQ